MEIEKEIDLLKNKIESNNTKKESVKSIAGAPIHIMSAILNTEAIGMFINDSTIFTKAVVAIPALAIGTVSLGILGTWATIVSPAWIEYLARASRNKKLEKKLKKLEQKLVVVEEDIEEDSEKFGFIEIEKMIGKENRVVSKKPKEQYKTYGGREQE